jgi:peptidoglycan/xylan/chitin deacetylase (PgdA/CDA1 family)
MSAAAQHPRALRHAVRDAGARVLWALGATRPARSARGALTIVTFHRVLPSEAIATAPLPGLCVTPHFLDGALGFFARHFRCLGVSDALRALAGGEPERFPGEPPLRPLLAISFDDGRADNFQHARPLLAKHGVPATFYAVADAIGSREPLWPDALALEVQALAARGAGGRAVIAELFATPLESARDVDLPKLAANAAKAWPALRIADALARLRAASGGARVPSWERAMSWDELAQLARDGHELGSHSLTHAILLRACAPDLAAEVAGSKRALEARLGVPVRSFCYPSGLYDAEALAAVAGAGYENATTTRAGVNRDAASPFELRRVDVDGGLNARRDGSVSESVLAWRLARSAA